MVKPIPQTVPIAVIGMSFKFPDDATSDDSFWDMLTSGRCAAIPIPKDRFAAQNFYHNDTNRLDTLPNQVGHFLKGDIGAFDAPFFSITPQEAAAMDPQSRALLETAYCALENAGISLQECSGSNASVYVGCSGNNYQLMYAKDPERPIRHAATGLASNMLSNKISWFYDLRGSSMTIDTACSSSLNAVHLACESLQSGNADMALVGGSELYLTPDSMAPLAHLNFLSPDGKCFSFDHRANGYSRGEGHGILVLKRLSDAINANNHIRAVIRATGSNENGRTPGGIAKVNLAAQEDLIRRTYKGAGLDLAQTRYVEAHGPGTAGDIVECAALAAVFAKERTLQDPLYLGSVKANIGHLEGASGIPALIKTVLSLERGVIPRLANFRRLHPEIAAKGYPFSFPEENVPWPIGVRRASINSFGFGGSNAHVVIEDAQPHLPNIEEYHLSRAAHVASSMSSVHIDSNVLFSPKINARSEPTQANGLHIVDTQEDRSADRCTTLSSRTAQSWLVVFSAADKNGLARTVDAWDSYLKIRNHSNSTTEDDELKHLSYTLSRHRTQLPWRTFMVATGMPEMNQLSQKCSKGIRALDRPRIAFVFNGQGSQWAQMGLNLLRYDIFRKTLLDCQTVFRLLGAQWNLLDELERPPPTSNINSAQFSQPICTAIQIALVCLLRSFGVYPVAVVGHSSGEMAAAFCVGGLSLRAACKVAFFRGVVSQQLQESKEDTCGMMAVSTTAVEAAAYIKRIGQVAEHFNVSIACINSPSNVTLSGSRAHLEQLKEVFESESIFARFLHVQVAYHSSFMGKVALTYEKAIGHLESDVAMSSEIRFFSTVYGKEITAHHLLKPSYWVKNLTSTVLFSDALGALCTEAAKEGVNALVEIGPHSALRMPAEQVLNSLPLPVKPYYYSALSRNMNDEQILLQLLGSLHCLGCSIQLDAQGIYERPKLLQGLPEYPFDHSKSYWHESRISRNHRHRKFPRSDFLGVRVTDWNSLNPRWRNIIRTLENPWIEDHRIDGTLLYPGAGMLVMAIEAAAQHGREFDSAPLTGFRLKDVSFLKSLNISQAAAGTETQIVLRPLKDAGDRRVTWSTFSIYLYENEEFAEVCNGSISLEFEQLVNPVDGQREAKNRVKDVQSRYQASSARCDRQVTTETLYRRLRDYGLELGSTFETFDKVRGNDIQEAVVEIKVHQWTCKGSMEQASPHFIHPTTLDGIIQLGITALSNAGKDDVPSMVPSRIGNLWMSSQGLNGSKEPRILCHANAKFRGYREASMNAEALSLTGKTPLVVLEGLEMTFIDTKRSSTAWKEEICYGLTWEPIKQQDASARMNTQTTPSTPLDYLSVKFVISEATDSAESASNVRTELIAIGVLSCQIMTVSQLSNSPPELDQIIVFFLDIGQSYLKNLGSKDFFLLKGILTRLQHAVWVQTKPLTATYQTSGEAMGLLRSLRSENERLKLVSLQFEPSEDIVKNMRNAILVNIIPKEGLHKDTYEPEQLVRADGEIYVSRLEPRQDMNSLLATNRNHASRQLLPFGAVPDLKLGIGTPGSLETFQFEQDCSPSKELDQYEIEVRPIYSGLNFMDCLTALGRIPQNVLGIEGSGIVVRSGTASDLIPGDRVMLCSSGTFKSMTRCHHQTAIKIPDDMSLDVAAALPGTGGTVYHALYNVARLQAGESILIHAGAGATGQMAVQMALNIGAIVYVSVGSQEKVHHIVRNFGVPEENIFYSRNTAFAGAIRRATNGRGVDVILNSLAGDSLTASWECIASFGRFLEIGKRDIYSHKSLPMFPFARNVSFHAIDLAGIWLERPSMMRKIHEGVLKLWQERKLQVATPLHTFPVGQVEEAFRLLQSGRCTGKIVLHMDPESIVPTCLPPQPTYKFSSDVTYVISGGLGGLGRSAAQWMVRRKAKHLLLLSRFGPKTPEAISFIAELRAEGVNVVAPPCDITNHAILSKCLQECRQHMPPIGGCIQAAMVLRDKFFTDMTFEDWQESLRPKTLGSWNLHSLLPNSMSFFILLSSMSGIIGGRGQSNYAAGNTFQDALARHRVSNGQKATSLDLGMMLDVGVVAQNPKLMQSMTSNGFYLPMTQSDFHTLLDHYCNPSLQAGTEFDAQLICGIASPPIIRSRGVKEPTWMHQPLFTSFWTTETTSSSSQSTNFTPEYRTLLQNATTPLEAAKSISNALVHRLSRSLCIPETDIERNRPLHFYGVDSLVAVELRNWFSTELQADVAIFDLLGNKGCDELALLSVTRSNFRNPAWEEEIGGEGEEV